MAVLLSVDWSLVWCLHECVLLPWFIHTHMSHLPKARADSGHGGHGGRGHGGLRGPDLSWGWILWVVAYHEERMTLKTRAQSCTCLCVSAFVCDARSLRSDPSDSLQLVLHQWTGSGCGEEL